jgi:non-ribosomal peptide synthetase component F
LEKVIGLFANPLALRVRIDSDAKFSDLLAQVRATTLEAYSHQDVPFVRLLEELSLGHGLGRNPICQAMFVWHYMLAEMSALGGLEWEGVEVEGARTNFDVELHAVERAGAVHLQWTYNRDMFDRWRIERMAQQFELLLRAAVATPGAPLREFMSSRNQNHAVPPQADQPLKYRPEELC